MIDQSIEIKGLFADSKFSHWEEATKKMLKTEELEQKLTFKSIEGFDLFPLDVKTDFICELETFPDSVALSDKTEDFDINICEIHSAGASIVQELGFAAHRFIELLESKKQNISICVAVDSLYFSNIAKLRALRFLIERLNEESPNPTTFKIYAFNSLREQTLFDPWVNMLRNVTSSMAAIIGGADTVNSFSYDELFTTYTNEKNTSLGVRQSLNHLKILLEESHLSQVKDYSKGSYSIENLTHSLIGKAWELAKAFTTISDFSKEVKLTSDKRRELARSRKITITGVNNFANAEETLENIYQKSFKPEEKTDGDFPLRHVSFEFDSLRAGFNPSKNPVSIVLFGDTSKLSGRANFCQNCFEVLGAKVEETLLSDLKEAQHIIICASDEDYSLHIKEYITQVKASKPLSIYLAGNFDHGSVEIKSGLFMGQNIFKILSEFKAEVCL